MRFESTTYGAEVAIGRRIFDFSFLNLSYRYAALADVKIPDGLSSSGPTDTHSLSVTYGWNSEDDPYFPTRGSRASLISTWTGSSDPFTGGGIRKTWTTENGTSWVVQAEDTPTTAYRMTFVEEQFRYFGGFARPIHVGEEIQRGRWYVEAGYSPRKYSPSGRREYGVKLGARLKTRTFGFVDLYVVGSVEDRSAW